MAKLKDYTNMVFGQFKIIEDLGNSYVNSLSKKKRRFVKVQCLKCDITYESILESFSLGKKVCDCDKRILKTNEWKRIAKIRFGMIDRCNNEESKDYPRYGQRNIKVCCDWLVSCKLFYEWSLENGYGHNLQIDRIDNDKGYSPENCRWVTRLEQARNKKFVTKIEKIKNAVDLLKKGKSRIEICKELNLSYGIVKSIHRGRCWKDIN
jgi:hypothetical protein